MWEEQTKRADYIESRILSVQKNDSSEVEKYTHTHNQTKSCIEEMKLKINSSKNKQTLNNKRYMYTSFLLLLTQPPKIHAVWIDCLQCLYCTPEKCRWRVQKQQQQQHRMNVKKNNNDKIVVATANAKKSLPRQCLSPQLFKCSLVLIKYNKAPIQINQHHLHHHQKQHQRKRRRRWRRLRR